MGFYAERLFPRLMNWAMSRKSMRPVRARVCAPLAGEVLEIGFGTGLNLPYLPAGVEALRVVDPLERGRALAAERLASSPVPVTFVGLDGQRLTVEDDSADAVLCTWSLCSIPDPVAAVREVARVLRPAGSFHFVEHGRSPDPRVVRWQKRLNPIQRRVACGCNLDRDIPAIVEQGGLKIDALDTYYMSGEPKPFGWTFEGTATTP